MLSSVSLDDNLHRSVKLSELNGVEVLDALGNDDVLSSGLDGSSLGIGLWLLILLSLFLKGIVLFNSGDESNTGLRLSDVLDSHVDSLGDNSSIDGLVDNDTDGMSSNIEDSTSLTMVELVRHTLVDGTVGNDINVVTHLVVDKVP